MSDNQDYSEIARYCQSDDPCLTQCQSGNFMAGHLYTCSLEVEQLRADKRKLVESLKVMTAEYRKETTQQFVQAPPWLKCAEDLITKHGES